MIGLPSWSPRTTKQINKNVLYIRNGNEACVLVLDQADVLRLQSGPLGTPDGKVLLALSPDLAWTSAAFREAEANGGLTTQKVLAILATSIAKPQPGEI
jgi:hypothetical protein